MEALAREVGLEVVAREAAVMAPEAMVWEVAAAARAAVAARAVFPTGVLVAVEALAREVGAAKALGK